MTNTRILVYATSPLAQSGYATASRYVDPLLEQYGFDVFHHAWNSHRGIVLNWQPPHAPGVTIPLLPAGNTITSIDVLAYHINSQRIDLLLTIVDPWIIPNDQWRAGHRARIVHWHPCQNDPPGAPLVNAVKGADLGLNYSRWGTETMRAAGADNVHYCPLGVDTNVFRPINRAEARQWMRQSLAPHLDLTDRFIITTVAANASTLPIMRKAFDLQALAFARFKEHVAPEALWYIHTDITGLGGGFDLQPMLATLGLRVGEDVIVPNDGAYRVGLGDDFVAQCYAASDLLSAASLGEGFGLPILEAQACGIPAVTSNWSSMPELTAYGYIARLSGKQYIPGNLQGWVGVPDVDDIVQGYRAVYVNDEDKIGARQAGLDLAASLRWERVVEDYLVPYLRRVCPVEMALEEVA